MTPFAPTNGNRTIPRRLRPGWYGQPHNKALKYDRWVQRMNRRIKAAPEAERREADHA